MMKVPIYICDPEKNKDCNKTLCQEECIYTQHKEYAKFPWSGVYIETEESEENDGR